MLKLIRADIYKTFRRAGYFVLLAVCAALAVMLVVMAKDTDAASWSGAMMLGAQLLYYPAALLPIITQFTMGEEYREHTVKNTLSAGTDRQLFFCSKWVSTVLLGLLTTAVVYVAFFGSAAVLFAKDAAFGGAIAGEFARRLGTAFAIYVAAATMSLFFLVMFNRSALAIFLYYGAFYMTELLLMLFRQGWAEEYLLKTQLSLVSAGAAPDLAKAVATAAVTAAVFFVAGLAVSEKKDLT